MDEVLDSTRSRAAASALGSVRAEGLEPDALTLQVLDLWSRGIISNEQLALVRRRLAAQQPVRDLLPVGSLP